MEDYCAAQTQRSRCCYCQILPRYLRLPPPLLTILLPVPELYRHRQPEFHQPTPPIHSKQSRRRLRSTTTTYPPHTNNHSSSARPFDKARQPTCLLNLLTRKNAYTAATTSRSTSVAVRNLCRRLIGTVEYHFFTRPLQRVSRSYVCSVG